MAQAMLLFLLWFFLFLKNLEHILNTLIQAYQAHLFYFDIIVIVWISTGDFHTF